MYLSKFTKCVIALALANAIGISAYAQMGRRFPSEKKVVKDPVTGIELTFLTSTPKGDSKIYPTHPQWTADSQWVVFRSTRAGNDALAVNEKTGDIVQITEGGYRGALAVATKSMRLFFARAAGNAPQPPREPGQKGPPSGPAEIVSVDLGRVFADSAAGKMQPAKAYETVHGVINPDVGVAGELAIDANEKFVYFKLNRQLARKMLPEGTEIKQAFGMRNMGAGPDGVAKMNLETGETIPVVAVPFQVGHVQTNPWTDGEVIFCWETGGKAPQRAWYVKGDGSGLRPLFPETQYDWVTHEAVIGPDEVALAILGHRSGEALKDAWGPAGSREHAGGLGIVNLRTNHIYIAGQTKAGSGFWHVHGSADGRWAVGDDFSRSLYLIDRRTNEMMLITTGHKPTAADHPHPTFSPDGTRFEIQSAMLSADDRAMNICIVPVPEEWLKRTYDEKKYPSANNPLLTQGRP